MQKPTPNKESKTVPVLPGATTNPFEESGSSEEEENKLERKLSNDTDKTYSVPVSEEKDQPPNEYGFLVVSSGSEIDFPDEKPLFPKKSDFYESSHEGSDRRAENNNTGVIRYEGFSNLYSQIQEVRFVELFDEKDFTDDDSEVPVKKRRLNSRMTELKGFPKAFSFDDLTEAQKGKILQLVGECVEKILHSADIEVRPSKRSLKQFNGTDNKTNRKYTRQFIHTWLWVKMVEIVLSNAVICLFVFEGTYLVSLSHYLPLIITFAFTTALVYVTFAIFSCSLVHTYNPLHLMTVAGAAVVSVSTSTGTLIIMYMIRYYNNPLQIALFSMVGFLCFFLALELSVCYFELKISWMKIDHLVSR